MGSEGKCIVSVIDQELQLWGRTGPCWALHLLGGEFLPSLDNEKMSGFRWRRTRKQQTTSCIIV